MGAMPPPTPPPTPPPGEASPGGGGGSSPSPSPGGGGSKGGGMEAAASADPTVKVAMMAAKKGKEQVDKFGSLIKDFVGLAKSFTEDGPAKTETPENNVQKQTSGTEPNPPSLLDASKTASPDEQPEPDRKTTPSPSPSGMGHG